MIKITNYKYKMTPLFISIVKNAIQNVLISKIRKKKSISNKVIINNNRNKFKR